MARAGRRLRGWLLRLVMNRAVAIAFGLVLMAPAAVLLLKDYSWESGVTDGLGLIIGATGIALLAAGLGGKRPDWIE
jgi:hypothetical protein